MSDSGKAPSAPWSWPDELDALVAAPKHHRVLLENAQVRVLDTRIAPGEIVPLHTHRWPATYHVISWGDFVRRDAEGKVQVDTRGRPPVAAGAALWSEPLGPHTLENVGVTDIHVVSIELKTASAAR
ncbi:MAG: cupin domain-containing protein [Opitutae bacterium]|nr:cupin domain-containing protein [Opitutae bacterium]